MITPGYTLFKLQYSISPIYLTGGIAGQMAGAWLPLIALLQSSIYTAIDLATGDLNLDNFFAYFIPQPGASIVHQQIGMYPFANQSVAANAVITEPLAISMQMVCPARHPGDYY